MSMGILYIIAGVQEYFRRKIWFKEQYLIIVKILLAIIVFMICLFGSMNGERVYVNADEWNNPVEYYNKYGTIAKRFPRRNRNTRHMSATATHRAAKMPVRPITSTRRC